MVNRKKSAYRSRGLALALGLLGVCGATGCQVDIAGQTLPSPYYLHDDVQYFAPGSEFKLPLEAARLKEASQDIEGEDF